MKKTIMNTAFRILSLVVILSLQLFLQNVKAQDKAKKIVQKYVEKIGGQKALDKIQTLSYSFEMNHLEENKIYSRDVYQKRPNSERYESTNSKRIYIVNSEKRFIGDFDDKNNSYKWTEKTNKSNENYILKRFGIFLDYEKQGFKLKYIGEWVLNNKLVDIVQVIFSETRSRLLYFNKDNGLFAGFKPDDNSIIEVKGYKQIGALYLPHIFEGKGTKNDGKKWHHVNTIIDLQINPKLENEFFSPKVK